MNLNLLVTILTVKTEKLFDFRSLCVAHGLATHVWRHYSTSGGGFPPPTCCQSTTSAENARGTISGHLTRTEGVAIRSLP